MSVSWLCAPSLNLLYPDVEHIRYELVTYLIASRDTVLFLLSILFQNVNLISQTASLLTFIIYFFAMHPDVCERLRDEVLDAIGPHQPPSYENLKGLKYRMFTSIRFQLNREIDKLFFSFPVRAVFNETLRLFPSAPLIARRSGDVSLVIPTAKGPLYFPQRTQVMNISLLLHRRHDLWGDDADEFRPDRWFDPKTLAKVNSTPFMYCPFSGGPKSVSVNPFFLVK